MPFPIDIIYINETENKLNTTFPELYKNRMLKMNGGDIETNKDEWQLFPFFDKSDKKRIKRTCNHIALETQQARKWANFPKEAIAIASNGFGDLLFLHPVKESDNKLGENIYLWLHENGNIKKLADSINQLENNTL
ncbi:MAG: SMI1/KNR4 family protein [Flavobacterium psychrophilum]|nr:MAG: SMI1/KNR4 family protein [Flavobacterium psychrophilum]